MAAEYPSLDIRDLPDLVRLAEQVRATRVPRLLRQDTTELAVLMPVPRWRHGPSRATPMSAQRQTRLLAAGWVPRDAPAQLGFDF